MKSILFMVALTLALIPVQMAHAIGNEGVGGGDLCEARFKIVAGDLQTWLKAGGAQGLVLKNPQGEISQAAYTAGMLSQIANFHVTCVSPGDPGYPVMVAGQAKECRSMRDSARSQKRFIGLACSREAAIDTDPSGSVLIGQVGETDIVASSLKTGRLLGLVWSQDPQIMSYYQGLSVLSADRALVVTQGPTATPAPGSDPLDLTIRILEIPQEP